MAMNAAVYIMCFTHKNDETIDWVVIRKDCSLSVDLLNELINITLVVYYL